MTIIADIIVLLIALIHLYFLVLEMFLWDKQAGLRAFGQTPEQAGNTKVLAANQGLYNGFIAVGLLWGLYQGTSGYDFKVFFLLCVIIAGVYGGFAVSRKILFFQAVPGLIGLVLVFISN